MRTSYQIGPDAVDAGRLWQPLPPLASTQAQELEQAQDQGHPWLRVRVLFLPSGFALGVLLGEVFFGGPFPAALVGLTGGMLAQFMSGRN